jgi:hypothetical protein
MCSLRYNVVFVALMACVAFTALASNRDRRDGIRDADLSSLVGSVTERGRPELAISDEQRGHIFDIVMRISDTPVANGPPPEIADALPQQVPMQDLPADISRDIPLIQGYKFVKFDDRILIVNPTSRLVVAMIPRYKLML